jgi:hypothetical protein
VFPWNSSVHGYGWLNVIFLRINPSWKKQVLMGEDGSSTKGSQRNKKGSGRSVLEEEVGQSWQIVL